MTKDREEWAAGRVQIGGTGIFAGINDPDLGQSYLDAARDLALGEVVAGAPGRTRTCDPRFRKPVLYPAELRALGGEG